MAIDSPVFAAAADLDVLERVDESPVVVEGGDEAALVLLAGGLGVVDVLATQRRQLPAEGALFAERAAAEEGAAGRERQQVGGANLQSCLSLH